MVAVILLIHALSLDLHSFIYQLRAAILWEAETHNKKESLFL